MSDGKQSAAHRRATAALRAELQPRQLQREPRLSRRDEQEITDDIRRREEDAKQSQRSELAVTAVAIAEQVQVLRDAMHTSLNVTRGERNLARRIAHDLDVLTGMLEKPSERGVHL